MSLRSQTIENAINNLSRNRIPGLRLGTLQLRSGVAFLFQFPSLSCCSLYFLFSLLTCLSLSASLILCIDPSLGSLGSSFLPSCAPVFFFDLSIFQSLFLSITIHLFSNMPHLFSVTSKSPLPLCKYIALAESIDK